MKKQVFILIALLGCMGLLLTGCSQNGKTSSSKNSTTSNSTQKASSNQSTTSNSSAASDSNQTNANNSDAYLMLVRMDAVIKATLDVESKKGNTKVDYSLKSMTQNGKQVKFSLVPATDHEMDFQKGSIKALIEDGANSHSELLYNYSIDDHNNLSLLDIKTNKVIYQTLVADPNQAQDPTGSQ